MTLQIVQISDTHISLESPNRLNDLQNCVNAINALGDGPALVMHTGDVSHNGTPEEYHSARQLLDQLDVPYFIMPGNRDRRPALIDTFVDDRYSLPSDGWIQYAIDTPTVRLLAVDTLCEHSNKGQLCAGRLDHLESMLLADTSRPTALFLHHPPYEAVGIPDPYQYENWNDVDQLAKLLSRHNNICGMYCGHVHRFIDGEIAGIQASALSCLAGDLRKGAVSEEERALPILKVVTLPV